MAGKGSEAAEAHAALTRFVRRQAYNPGDVDDVVQESWLRLASAAPQTPIRNLGGYLRRIATNLIRDRHRRAAFGVEVSLPDDELAAIASPASGPEALLITRDELRRMAAVLAAMPARRREVFHLARIEGLTFAEIGRRLGISRQTVHEHMTQALLAIQAAADPQP